MRKWTLIFLMAIIACQVQAGQHVPDSVMHRDGLYVDNRKVYPDSAIFQGAILKLDLFNTIYYLAASQAKLQTYELGLNLRLKQRFYPTIELGYSLGEIGTNTTTWQGQGGWANVGLDFNGLRKNQQSLNALLVGLRVGTAVQQYSLKNVPTWDTYWGIQPTKDYNQIWRADCWGEILAGCQVNIYSGLMMGWYLKFKILFTRKENGTQPYPYYIPGFGYRDLTQWGIGYFIGWKF